MLPLIAAQPGIWVADKLSTFDNAYVVVHYIDLRGQLDVSKLSEAIMDGMKETDTLRMTYEDVEGEAIQVEQGMQVLPQPLVLDMRRKSNPMETAKLFMERDMNQNLRIDSKNQLICHAILHVGENHWLWYQRYHHIQVDAYSFTALTRRMAELYSSRLDGAYYKFSTSPFQPFQVVIDEYRAYQQSPKFVKDTVFWKEYCAKLPSAHTLSPKPLTGVQPSKNIIRKLKMVDHEKFKKFCELGSMSSTVNEADLALALVAVWLMKLSNCDTMSAGFIFMRRLGSLALNTSGPFINVLPMAFSRVGANFMTLAADISKTLKVIRRHQKLDSEEVIRNSGKNWDSNPIFGPVINFKAFDYRLNLAGLDYETHHIASGPIRDIELVIYINEKKQMEIEYLANGDRYDAEALDRHLLRLDLLLEQAIENPEVKCEDTSLILSQETHLITQVNQNVKEMVKGETLVSLMRKQAKSTPNACALKDSKNSLTYSEVQEQINALVHELKAKGIKSGNIVAVEMTRSIFMSLAMQAILALGCAYLPLDPSYPVDRLQMMIEDAKPQLVISSSHSCAPNTVQVMAYDSILEPQPLGNEPGPTEDQTAYIIYTSGSTGKPKGVMVSHKAIVNRLLWMQSEYQLRSDDVILQKTPSSFDVSVWELFWPLLCGSTLFMAPPDAHRDPEQLLSLIIQHKVTTTHFVPSMLSTFLNGVDASLVKNTLRRVFCSGEALPTQLSLSWHELTAVPLFNLYGPTEAAIDVTAYPAFGKYLDKTSPYVPIGFPVWNTAMYVFDTKMRIQPLGLAGDLYIAGDQLAQGYLNRPELTSERFIEVHGTRMYKTGDVARWLSNGALEFLGRSDDQVKLRGQRIELGEIDAIMETVSGVQRAVTQPQALLNRGHDVEDSRQLIGYLVEKSHGSVDLDKVKQQLNAKLPTYMVPVKFMIIENLPLNASGKLDRKALPIPSSETDTSSRRKPSSDLEKKIAEEFQTILGCSEVFAEDDFFSLGGHSLLAVRLAAVLKKKLDLPVTIGQIMQSPRVEMLAAKLSDDSNREAWKTAGFEGVLPLRKADGPTVFCIHPASGFSWQFSVLRRYLDPSWSLIGIQSAESDGPMDSAMRLEEVIESHFKTVSEYTNGPYYLLGYSLGGTIAHSLASKLQKAGKTVAFLGLLDTWPPETQNWDEKRQMNVVDEAVVEEMQRERQQFLEASKIGNTKDDGFSSRMFDIIEANYSNAVRLLATARSSRYEGETTLFVAKKTFPPGMDLNAVWKPWTQKLSTVEVDCSHVDIIHPGTFTTLGPKINELMNSIGL